MLAPGGPAAPAGVVRVGCAGWTIPRSQNSLFPAEGSHLERYAARFDGVEINSSFHRPHRHATYERWSASVPEDFRFSVKLPKALSHERRLVGGDDVLERFLDETAGLGHKLGPILVQLPPSFSFERKIASPFFEQLRARFTGHVALEPRHPSWFTHEVESLLCGLSISRVAADPALAESAERFAGFAPLAYLRLHGTPKVYHSAYGPERLREIAGRLSEATRRAREVWCIFDNTTLGAAQADAGEMIGLLREYDVI